MKLHPSEVALLQDLATAKNWWKSAAAEGISEPRAAQWIESTEAWSKLSECVAKAGANEAFVDVVSELLSGLIHSVLVSLDGGTSLAETTLITLQDEEGYEFKRFLHEFWPEYADGMGSSPAGRSGLSQ